MFSVCSFSLQNACLITVYLYINAGVLVVVEHIKEKLQLDVAEGGSTSLSVSSGASFNGVPSICRYLARAVPTAALYGSSNLEKAEVCKAVS